MAPEQGLTNIRRMELTVDINNKSYNLKLFTQDRKTHTVSGMKAISTAARVMGLQGSSYTDGGIFDGMTFTGNGPLALWLYCKLSEDDPNILRRTLA